MAKEKKYYWLKLKEDFFEEDTIKFLREQPNGSEYCIFYLILCLKSLRTDGRLARIIGDTIVPYDVKALANLTGVLEDTVRGALTLLLEYGVVKQLESGELYLQQVEEMVGSETKWAELKRRRRDKAIASNIASETQKIGNVVKNTIKQQKNVVKNTIQEGEITGENEKTLENVQSMSNQCPKNVQPEIEIEKEIELEKEKDKEKKASKKETFDSILEDRVADEDLRMLFLEFIKMRKMIRAPLTNYALKLAINKAEKLSKGDVEKAKRIVEQSIERSWKGLFDVPDEVKDNRVSSGNLYKPKDGEDITYQRMFEVWKKFLGYSIRQTNANVQACKDLLADIGEERLVQLMAALRMRAEHKFLTKELRGVADFVGLKENVGIVQGFYDEHWKFWKMRQEAESNGEKVWEL